ncbi:4a-hydroxytetrahydrobiopterin dehydratase [Williamsia deligens]|uniref:Putative pterin-4-alpha-carbinolamine dehydratase n=1 Tax=Williamsia deligens TaxID=321325 RepID=A0ABW3G3Z7_9NOCA|nr:4a-hydroxytetrahydrobiopterin dehydratase [Williamsia deligens]MCP2194961.1 4a-hydroxytetrahydrobiopterin dehydratase [Williamsia deligens]
MAARDDTLLTDDEREQARTRFPDWSVDDTRMSRSYDASSFLAGIEIVGRVAQTAEDSDHHPDIDIRWRTLTFTLSTHSAGGLTVKDTALAQVIDSEIAADGQATGA